MGKQLSLLDSPLFYVDETCILDKVYKIYGEEYQNNIAVEELSELTKAITKINRAKYKGTFNSSHLEELADEVADVSIILDELKSNYRIAELIKERRKQKITRLVDRTNQYILSKT